MSIFFTLLNRHILLRKANYLTTPLPEAERRRILSRSIAGLAPYALATALAPVSAYATLAICTTVAVYYAFPVASGTVRANSWHSTPRFPGKHGLGEDDKEGSLNAAATATRVLALSLTVLGLAALPAPAKPPTVFNPVVEAQNFSITQQRQKVYDTPQYQEQLSAASLANLANALAIQAADPGRFFTNDLCWNQGNGCAGDVRLYNWGNNDYGLVRPVLFTARNGATLSGHVWATVAGPRKRPGVVITNGSVQADEQMYWYAAQTLAKDGYVVLTFDPQGQGQSDTFGQGADRNEGFPAQSDGRPFYDGTEDAINFLLSNPSHRYEPVKSCTTGTVHSAKQNSRVKSGLDAAYNPFWQLLNRKEIGLAGHSYGAAGVSYIAQWDPRVKAVVAWDNLGDRGPRTRRCLAGAPVRRGRPSARRAARRSRPTARRCRSKSRVSASPPTTAFRPPRTPRCPTRWRSRPTH